MLENIITNTVISKELRELIHLRKTFSKTLDSFPKGSLHIHQYKKRKTQYYLHDGKKTTYIQQNDQELIRALAQKEYNQRLVSAINSKIACLEYIQKHWGDSLRQIYKDLLPARKELVVPYDLTDEEYIKRWRESLSQDTNPIPINTELYTDNNEQVRSKSEKMLADTFSRYGIPYVYEPKIVLENNVIFYPDFALLDVKRRKTIYHEHFGLMDDPEYVSKTMKKINQYMLNGLIPGDSFTFTMESASFMINMKVVDEWVRHCFSLD